MKHEKIQTPISNENTDTVEMVPLAELYVSDLNPRTEVSEEGIQQLADSILACGLIQNIAGLRDNQGKVGIVAGGRRLRALQIVAEHDIERALVPVRIAPDAETALQWANAENSAREELAPADEIRAYGKMAEQGTSVEQISKVFGVSEAHVRRRLALAHLPEHVLDAVKDGSLSLTYAKLMTTSSDTDRINEALALATGGDWCNEHSIRRILTPEAVAGTDRKAEYVGEDAYTGAGGTLTRDLFAEQTLFEHPEILNRLFEDKLNQEAEALRVSEGWAWAEIVMEHYISYGVMEDNNYARTYREEGELTEQQSERYDELANLIDAEAGTEEDAAEFAALEAIIEGQYSDQQKALSGIIVYLGHDGALNRKAGLVRLEDQAQAVSEGIIQENLHQSSKSGPKADKPAYSQKFRDDMQAIRLGALQTALMEKPELVLDLFGFAVSAHSGYLNRILGLSVNEEANAPTIDDGYTLSKRIGGELSDEDLDQKWSVEREAREDMPAAFEKFRETGKKNRNAEITQYLARAVLSQKGGLMEVLEEGAEADIRSIWTPGADNCFKRLTASQLDVIYADLIDLGPEDEQQRSFTKLKKGEKVSALHSLFNDPEYRSTLRLTADQEAKVAAWVPDCN